MAQQSTIEWTNATWNPVTGCSKVSPGCKNCYAERMASRLQAMGVAAYRNGFAVTLQPKQLTTPLGWKRSRLIFVNSMSDLLHERVPLAYISRVFDVMRAASWHQFQVLTKRAERLQQLADLEWPTNLWMGVSVETPDYFGRIERLTATAATVKFLSLEPLLAPLPNVPLIGIDWVIVGGESGPHARPIRHEWVIDIREQCSRAGVPFFFKQWGGTRKKKTGRLLDGATHSEMPVAYELLHSRAEQSCSLDAI